MASTSEHDDARLPLDDTIGVESGGTRATSPWTLERLLGSISVRDFCEQYWTKECLFLERRKPGFYDDLVSLSDIDRCFAMEQIFSQGSVSSPREGHGRPDPAPNSARELYARLLAGSALRIRNLEKYMDPFAPVLELVRDIERKVQQPLESLSCYVAPPEAVGLGPHHDDTEIFTLQISGVKRWRTYHRVEAGTSGPHKREELPPSSMDILLRPGDLLYIPSGVVHDVTSDRASFSLTIVFAPMQWRSMIEVLIARTAKMPAFQQTIPAQMLLSTPHPPSFEEEVRSRLAILQAALAQITLKDVLDELAPALLRRMMACPHIQLHNLAELSELRLQSRVAPRQNLDWHLNCRNETVQLTIRGGANLQAHACAKQALCDVLARTEPFAVAEMHPSLEPDGKIALARILVANGILERLPGE